MLKKKYKNKGLDALAEASINVAANPWYPPTPTTLVVGSSYGTTQYYAKEDPDTLIGRLKETTTYHDDDKFLVCIEVDDYTAEYIWIRLDQIVAIIKNKQKEDSD